MATASAAAGDEITVQWDQSTHPGPITHFLFGPIEGGGGAEGAAGTGAGWFKIDELAHRDGLWANEIMSADEMKHTFRLPENLPAGEYLVRFCFFLSAPPFPPPP